jgi:F-type H+-transporting ATPase subunit b
MREQAVAEIDSERQRAIADVRGQVAELALLAAGKVVGETMTGQRERRLVDEFLTQVSAGAASPGSRN